MVHSSVHGLLISTLAKCMLRTLLEQCEKNNKGMSHHLGSKAACIQESNVVETISEDRRIARLKDSEEQT